MTDRIPYGSFKNMTVEEKRQHRRDLQKRWREKNPEWVKASNKYWYDFYHRTKPYTCICKRCGCEFQATRPYMKICGKCPSAYQIKKQEILKRREEKAKFKELIADMYFTGHFTQQQLADKFGITQEVVSKYVREEIKRLTQKL